MIFILLTFLAALALAAVSGWFSIVGFMAIYAGAPMYALIMGVVVECAKLVTTSWLYRNSKTASWKLKAPLYYFTIALMAATSIGVFGFLSKAHLEQGASTVDNGPKIERLNYQIEREKSIIADNEKVIKQLDDTVNSFLGKERTDKSLAVRKSQAPQRKQLREDIDASQKRIDELSEEKLKLESEVRKMQLEVGPIRYIAELVYGVQEDSGKNVEAAVRMFTLLIVSTLDPLAVALLIAANHSLAHWRKKDEDEDKKDPGPVESSAVVKEVLPEEGSEIHIYDGTYDTGTTFAPDQEEEDLIYETFETAKEVAEVEIPAEPEIGLQTVLQGSAEMVEEIQGSSTESEAIEMGLKVPDAKEEQDTTHTNSSSGEPVQQDWISTLASAPEETEVEEVLGTVQGESTQEYLEEETPNSETEGETFIEFLKPSWELPTEVETKVATPWAQQDTVLRELLGQHFTPIKVNEKEEIKTDPKGESTGIDKADNGRTEDTSSTWSQTEVSQMVEKGSLQDQALQILPGEDNKQSKTASLSDPVNDKYPKALSWLNEFRRD